jgi:hypothetical protein
MRTDAPALHPDRDDAWIQEKARAAFVDWDKLEVGQKASLFSLLLDPDCPVDDAIEQENENIAIRAEPPGAADARAPAGADTGSAAAMTTQA